jgi:hypothetical protein
MIIAIDYDKVYTSDCILWDNFCIDAIRRGNTIYCVSFQNEKYMDDAKNTIGKVIGPANCFGTDATQKDEFMLDNHNIKIDIWIDEPTLRLDN